MSKHAPAFSSFKMLKEMLQIVYFSYFFRMLSHVNFYFICRELQDQGDVQEIVDQKVPSEIKVRLEQRVAVETRLVMNFLFLPFCLVCNKIFSIMFLLCRATKGVRIPMF